MSPTVLIIGFIGMAIFTATVVVVGTLLAADLMPHGSRPTPIDPDQDRAP